MGTLASIFLYIGVFAASAFVVQYGYKRKSKVLQALGLFLPITLAGLRYNVGLDYQPYLDAYADITNPLVTLRYDATPGLEVTFKAIAHVSHFLFSSPVPLFFVYATITVLAFYAALRIMRPKNVGYALFFFYSIFFLNSFNIMRQGAAMSIGALALVHYTKGGKRKALMYIILAMLFHVSALLIVLFIAIEYLIERYVLVRKKLERFTRLFAKTFFISVALVAIGLSVPSFGNFIYEATGRIGDYDAKMSLGVVFKYLVVVISVYLSVYAWPKLSQGQKRLVLFTSVGMVVYAVGLIHNEAARLGMYLIVLTPVLTAVIYDKIDVSHFKSKVFLTVGLSLLCSLYILSVHTTGDGVKYHYDSVIGLRDYTQVEKEMGL